MRGLFEGGGSPILGRFDAPARGLDPAPLEVARLHELAFGVTNRPSGSGGRALGVAARDGEQLFPPVVAVQIVERLQDGPECSVSER